MENLIEIWKSLPFYEGLYEISNLGRVKSLPKKGSFIEKIKKLGIDVSNNYVTVMLSKNNKSLTKRVHSLVMETFCEKPQTDYKLCIDHIDGNKYNNNLTNLEYVSYSENSKRAYKLGLNISKKGEQTHNSKLSTEEVKSIVNLYNNSLSAKKIAEIFNVTKSTIEGILSKSNWKHLNLTIRQSAYKTNCSLEKIKLVKSLQNSGFSKLKIEKITGISRKSIIYKKL